MASAVRFGAYQKSSRPGGALPRPHPSSTHRDGALKDQLTCLTHELDDLRRALNEAAQVQRRLCGPRSLRFGSYALASEIFPVGPVSGDFIIVLPQKRDLVFALGDIAGKGVMAGMWFLQLVGTIRRYIGLLEDPAAVVAAVDRDLRLTGLEMPLTTVFVARLNPASGDLTYCNAGHPPALLTRNGATEELSTGGPLLGSVSEAKFVSGTARLCPGDVLLAYSDGIIEARNSSGVEFGTAGLLRAIASRTPGPSETLFAALAAVEGFVQNKRQEDDIALLVLQRLENCQIL